MLHDLLLVKELEVVLSDLTLVLYLDGVLDRLKGLMLFRVKHHSHCLLLDQVSDL